MITQEYIKKILKYSSEDGDFVWIKSVGRNCKIGGKAGWVSKSRGKSYIKIKICGKNFFAHRLAWMYMRGFIPDEVDHIDGNGQNNKWSNLRESNRSHNMKNMRLPSTNKSGVIGVYWRASISRWIAEIKINQKKHYLGSSTSLFEAACLRKSAEAKYGFSRSHGEVRPL